MVDTNVAVVANGRDTHAGAQCQLECVRRLQALVEKGVVVLDEQGLIIKEYRNHLQPSGQPGVGDAFFRHLFDHQYDARRCELVPITPLGNDLRGFEEFPDDQAFLGFDADDRKFVAAARASARDPSIINATDSDWVAFEAALVRHGVRVEQLCPYELVARPDHAAR